jgi:hypothetical protein
MVRKGHTVVDAQGKYPELVQNINGFEIRTKVEVISGTPCIIESVERFHKKERAILYLNDILNHRIELKYSEIKELKEEISLLESKRI